MQNVTFLLSSDRQWVARTSAVASRCVPRARLGGRKGIGFCAQSGKKGYLCRRIMDYKTTTLSNGLRVIMLPSASPVVYCGYEVAAGTSDERPGEEGLAHFCEHVTFKGTARRTAMDVINSLETVGGELNAFTTKTDTVYYAAILREHLPRAVDLLSDIVFRSVYPQREIDKEVEVICDEIESYNDTPSDLIFDEFENLVFARTPLGHNILGTAERVRSFATEDALRFTRRLYRPDNAVFFASGDISFGRLVALLCEALGTCESASPAPKAEDAAAWPPFSNDCAGKTIRRHRHTHQAHVMVGRRGYPVAHPLRMALYLLNNILGGPGMNSRLNLSLRERNGLVYTVESTSINYARAGLWSVYFGCDHADVERCLALVRQELDAFVERPLTEEQLERARQQIKGQIALACDNRESFAIDFGKSFLHYGRERDIERLYRAIDAVTAADIQAVAKELFAPEGLTTLIYE